MPSRELTASECRDRLFAHLSLMVTYWRDLPNAQVLAIKPDGDVTHERLTGLLFSVLTALDGSALSVPGFHLVPDVSDEDWNYAIAAGEDYWPRSPINAGVELHDLFPFDQVPTAS